MRDPFLNGGYIGQSGVYSDGGIWLIDSVTKAPFLAAVGNENWPGSAGSFEVLDSTLNGAVPSGVLMMGGITSASAADASFTMGFGDASGNEHFITGSSDHGKTTTSTGRYAGTSQILRVVYNQYLYYGAAQDPSFKTGGMDITENGGRSNIFGYMFLSGCPVAVGRITPSGSVSGTATVSGLSFAPKAIIIINSWPGAGGLNVNSYFGFGVCDENLVQGSASWFDHSGLATSSVSNRLSNSYAVCDGYANTHAEEITSLNSDGFTVTTRIATYATSQSLQYIAIGGVRSHVVNTNTDSANKSIGSSDFTPTASVHSWNLTTTNGSATNSNAEYWSIGMASQGTSSIDSWYVRVRSQDGVGTSNCNNGYGAGGYIGHFGHIPRSLQLVSYNSSGGGVVNSSGPTSNGLVSLFLGPE